MKKNQNSNSGRADAVITNLTLDDPTGLAEIFGVYGPVEAGCTPTREESEIINRRWAEANDA